MKNFVGRMQAVGGLVLMSGLLTGVAGAQGYGQQGGGQQGGGYQQQGPPPPPPDGRGWDGPPGPPDAHWQAGGDATLHVNQSLGRGQSLFSRNGWFRLDFQTDGNVVLKKARSGQVLWATNTAGSPASRLLMQGDGNVVLYSRFGRPLWSSGVTGPDLRHGQVLVLQDDGNLVVYSRGRVYWASNTQRGPGGPPQGPGGWQR